MVKKAPAVVLPSWNRLKFPHKADQNARLLLGMIQDDLPKRRGKNRGGYRGDTIELPELLRHLEEQASAKRWQTQRLPFGESAEQSLLYLERTYSSDKVNILLSAGIHGDEPATTAAIAQCILEDELPGHCSYYVFPCLNPTGMTSGTRENSNGVDLNRDYFKKQTKEVHTHVCKLKALPRFDLALHLHEDWEAVGFYLYELSQENSPAIYGRRILDQVGKICPIELAKEIEGMPADRGHIHPRHRYLDRDDWPEAFHMMRHKTDQCLTLEAPSDFEINVRVKALITAVQTAIAVTLG